MDIEIHPTAKIECDDFKAGKGTIIRAHAEIYGTKVHLGREAFIDEYAVIGGGSAHDPQAFLTAGDWFHMGMFSQVNIARGVICGDEVGIGIGTRIFTHGAYLSEWDGFPCSFSGVTIGDRVWLPNAQVNPGTEINDNVVVAAGSVVSGYLRADHLYGGTPAKQLKPIDHDLTWQEQEKILQDIADEIRHLSPETRAQAMNYRYMLIDKAMFEIDIREIHGEVTAGTEIARNQLRRHGIRFKYEPIDGLYQKWNIE